MKVKKTLPIFLITSSSITLACIFYLFYGFFIKHFTNIDLWMLGFFEYLIVKPLLLVTSICLFVYFVWMLVWKYKKEKKQRNFIY